jgi:hypothetical protein
VRCESASARLMRRRFRPHHRTTDLGWTITRSIFIGRRICRANSVARRGRAERSPHTRRERAHWRQRSRCRRGDTRISSEKAGSLFEIRERSRYPVPPVGYIKKEVPRCRPRVRIASSSHLAACCWQSVTFSDGLPLVAHARWPAGSKPVCRKLHGRAGPCVTPEEALLHCAK